MEANPWDRVTGILPEHECSLVNHLTKAVQKAVNEDHHSELVRLDERLGWLIMGMDEAMIASLPDSNPVAADRRESFRLLRIKVWESLGNGGDAR